jgi:MoaA/NifB/PqqE/SkfB family radical SAM enzyme
VIKEEDIIALIRYLLEQGFHISNVFGNIPDENESKATDFTESEKSTIKNTALILALNRKLFKVVEFFTNEAFINWWNTKDLKA